MPTNEGGGGANRIDPKAQLPTEYPAYQTENFQI